METTRGATYTLDDEGYVLDRSNGPRGWDYAHGWQIIGIAKRHHSRWIVPLFRAVTDDTGHGIIHDLDHGTHRLWGNERMRSLVKVTE
jgi:hypothetical protein